MFPVKIISVWAIFSHPKHYHAYDGLSEIFRERISGEIAVIKKRLSDGFAGRTDIRIQFCYMDDLLALRPHHIIKPDVVLFLMESRNFEEGLYDPPFNEFELKAYLKIQKIPYTGCDALSLFSDYDSSELF